MNDITNMDISPLIRLIDAKKFSEKVHGPGYRLVYDHRTHKVNESVGLWTKFLGRNKQLIDYFVKIIEKPLVVKGISFQWSEGTSDIALDFRATFQIFFDGEDEAKMLVKHLYNSDGPAKALYTIIDKHLHREMTSLYDEVQDNDTNLLDSFYQNNSAVGESIRLDRNVSGAVVEQLGLRESRFRIGFQLENAPPRQIEVEKDTALNLADTDEKWQVSTSAMLVLNNYQRFKKSGLKSENDIKTELRSKIDVVVEQHLFKLQFFELIAKFQPSDFLEEKDSIRYKMEQQIKSDALAIGYDLKLFQTLPNVPPLKLINGLRVDVSSQDIDCEFKTKDSAGHVKLEVALETKVDDFEKLKRLITPKDKNIPAIIRTHVIQICRDEIQKIQRKQFNLAFNETVIPALTKAFEEQLGDRYGLSITVIHIIQAQTEDGERFQSLLRKAWPLKLCISPQADLGEGDKLEYEGKFEVISIAENGWEAFESKDFGFRRDSIERAPQVLKVLRQSLGDISEKEFEHEWKNSCIEKELDDIAERITMNLSEYFSKIENVAARVRTLHQSNEFRKEATKIAKSIVAEEFGLEIELRALQRMDSETDKEMQKRLEHERKIRSQVLESKQSELESHIKGRKVQMEKISEVRVKKLEDDASLGELEIDIDIAKIDEEQEKTMRDAMRNSKVTKKRDLKPLSQDVKGLPDEK